MQNTESFNTIKSEVENILTDEDFFSSLRNTEFSRLDKSQQCYLDYTGANLYPESLINKHFEFLKTNVFGNPHSENPTSKLSTKVVEETRAHILSFFNANDDYMCIFTANASEALHIVGECYPFDDESIFLFSADNHNSVNGIREYCKLKKGKVEVALINYEDLTLNEASLSQKLSDKKSYSNKLFAYPAQSNASGIKHSLNWVDKAHEYGWDILLDVAAFVPSSKLDLQVVKPDFVSISFYKIFGYPTGLGCLLVKKDKVNKLKKPWFAGGTVNFVSILYDSFYLTSNHERFENGTLNFLSIPAIKFGLEYVEQISMDRISNRIKQLSLYLLFNLQQLKHQNGLPLIQLFGSTDFNQKGGTFFFNMQHKDGSCFPFEDIETLANQHNISIRSGCFCNPGIDETHNCITNEELSKYYTSRRNQGDFLEKRTTLQMFHDMSVYFGKMRGAIRVSLGWATVKKDLDYLIDFLKTFEE